MHAVEQWKASTSTAQPRVEKYYGKWPFIRVLGMQELASVLASIANLLAHAICLARLRSHTLRPESLPARSTLFLFPASPAGPPLLPTVASPRYPFLGLWTAYGLLHMNAWLWSAVFHSRDTRATERLDYVSAILLVAFGLLAACVRMLWGPGRRRRLAVAAAATGITAGLALHLRYMLLVKFDYGWNMRVCVAAGVATAVLWLVWSAWTRHPARHRMYAFLLLVHVSMLLEVLDFPPLAGLLDAHAAWHVATVPLTVLFYSWVRADAEAVAAERLQKDT